MKLIICLALVVIGLAALALVSGRKFAENVHAMSNDELELAIENCDMWHEDADIYHKEVARRAAAATA